MVITSAELVFNTPALPNVVVPVATVTVPPPSLAALVIKPPLSAYPLVAVIVPDPLTVPPCRVKVSPMLLNPFRDKVAIFTVTLPLPRALFVPSVN